MESDPFHDPLPLYAFVSLVSSDSYLPGALALAAALKDVHPHPPLHPELPYQTVCLVTPETVDINTIKLLRKAFDVVVGVEVIDEDNEAGLSLLGRPDLATVLTKLHVFRLTQFHKLIFLDADVLPLRPLSHLFALPHDFSAVPDVGWPDIFNSGVMVLSPGEDKFQDIMRLVKTKGSWDGGDQGVLNEWRGNDWHRLSFTYNTTPTAAYTYAPAYERFGAQISAVHFIGPNKPWAELPYRAPRSSTHAKANNFQTSDQAEASSDDADADARQKYVQKQSPRQSYAYGALVDRWFDVYDRHYRSQAQAEAAAAALKEFEMQRYKSAWNENGVGSRTSIVGGGALGLEELRKAAIEGLQGQGGGFVSGSRQAGEGEYRSLPLEGRIDLMRPRREPVRSVTESMDTEESGESRREGDGGDVYRMETLPTPGPDEMPPTPRIPPLTIVPPTPPYVPPLEGHAEQQQSANDGATSQHHEQHHHHQHHDHQEPQQQHYHHEQHQQQQDHQPQNTYPPEPYQPQAPARPHSPPLLSWNPALEPPPNDPPPSTAFPAHSYFPNVWDIPSTASSNLHVALTGTPLPSSSSFFELPPQSQIPHRLVQEGHYTNVTGQAHQGGDGGHVGGPQPDRSKVTAVFPWEARARHTPGRRFPGSDEPPPGMPYIEDTPSLSETISDTKTESLPETVSQFSPDPPPTIPSQYSPKNITYDTRGYKNAWDHVVGIQRYAQRLTAPAPLNVSIPPPSPRRRRRADSFRSWEDRADANSMDGDVEDEGDDEDADAEVVKWGDSTNGNEDGDGDEKKRSKRERAASESHSKPAKTKYRSLGVQTLPREEGEFGVQVNLCEKECAKKREDAAVSVSLDIASPVQEKAAFGELESLSSSHPRRGSGGHIDLPAPIVGALEIRANNEQMAGSTPNVVSMQSFIKPPRHSAFTGTISPRLHDPLGNDSPRTYSPLPPSSPSTAPSAPPPVITTGARSPPTKMSITTGPPLLVVRTLSNETSTSPPTSAGPLSPTDFHHPAMHPRQLAGRRWNPATGVDVFKRGSEEVLARFLRMGAWEDESHVPSHTHTHSHPHTHHSSSAIS